MAATGTTARAEAGVSPVRQRILAAADAMFYAEGVRAVSADRIIAAAEVSKVTFYRHFPTKDDLVLAYLRGRSDWERAEIARVRSDRPGDPCGTLTAVAEAIVDASCAPGFRGCPFIHAAAEYADPEHPVRHAVAAHRKWFAGVLDELLVELGVGDRSAALEQLVVLRDGAMVQGYLGGGSGLRADTLVAAGRAVIEVARR
ncbi:TetR/AcrR family transcriptional regulator [Umezawaea beigongshangensis]|uniref:TetR/AcrR family transcriptional regulator n=1 Tax=Umezawaea beigongshangensis TaxID=2780383 RepID=UPI0018F1AE88|nr:TetR/AcrR family transcriptional regulator [Umezawaea beigongshangensis]